MSTTSRQLRRPKTLSASEIAKGTIRQAGLSPGAMSNWAELNIIRLLNQKSNSVTERVSWMVEACQRVIQLHESMKLPATLGPNKEALLTETGGILNELNARLSKYKCLPVVRYLASPSRCFDVGFEFLAAAKGEASECIAIAWLMDHIHAVHRVRRCRRQECRKWFFAVTEHQKYCGDTCRKRDAQQGPEFKRKRAEYMKETFRPRQRDLEAQAKRLARGKSK